MTVAEGIVAINPFVERCNEDKDPFFVVHFSREEDKFEGDHNGLDVFDAMIIIKQIAKDFNMDVSINLINQ